MFVYQLSLVCSLLLSEAFAQGDGGEEVLETTSGRSSEETSSGEGEASPKQEGDGGEEVSETASSSESNQEAINEFAASDQDIANFRQTFHRYSERMKDFRDETILWLI